MKQNPSHELRPLKCLLGTAVIGLGALALTTPGSGSQRPDVPDAGVRPVHAQLQIDAAVIEQMSTPNADTGRQNHRGDQQLERSSDLRYLAALEQHQTDIDRMLARP